VRWASEQKDIFKRGGKMYRGGRLDRSVERAAQEVDPEHYRKKVLFSKKKVLLLCGAIGIERRESRGVAAEVQYPHTTVPLGYCS
jgi:hypothetical protein